jgi:hypothetical protein
LASVVRVAADQPDVSVDRVRRSVVRRGTEITAGVGGIDDDATRVDEFPHRRLSVRGGRWGMA